MIKYCGLDVHKKVVEACVLDAAGAVLFRHRFTLTPEGLKRFCQEQLTPESQVVLEATSNTWAVVAALKPHVALVVVRYSAWADRGQVALPQPVARFPPVLGGCQRRKIGKLAGASQGAFRSGTGKPGQLGR